MRKQTLSRASLVFAAEAKEVKFDIPAQEMKMVPRLPKTLFIGSVNPSWSVTSVPPSRHAVHRKVEYVQHPMTAQHRYGAAFVSPRSHVSRYESPPMPNWSLYMDCAPFTTVSSTIVSYLKGKFDRREETLPIPWTAAHTEQTTTALAGQRSLSMPTNHSTHSQQRSTASTAASTYASPP